MEKLVIVESPTKAKTISHFVGKDFKVVASYGHIRDLPKSELGIDIENNFTPRYVIPTKARKNVTALKKASEKAKEVILATDEDREGEAIAYHIYLVLNSDKKRLFKRIVFHEITQRAIENALKNPREIDLNLVNAQQSRRILDRLVGYLLSPFLWKKIAKGLSAGRVQSAALKLIVEREKEIQNFKPQEYWEIWAEFLNQKKESFSGQLIKINDQRLEKFDIKTREEAQKIINDLENKKALVEKINIRITKKNPYPPFITSTLQQASWQKFHFPAKKTMMISQRLYEGIELGEGPIGLITYMRTDSFNLSSESLKAASKWLNNNLGENYALKEPRLFKHKSKLAQEAHEAIRPTDPFRTPESIKTHLKPDEFKIYDLIWRRFMASQMPQAVFENQIVLIIVQNGENKYLFQTNGQKMIFDGFLKIWFWSKDNHLLPALTEGEELQVTKLNPSQHFTQPPPRFNEATLIKVLEEYGIGRPSTYAPIISLIQKRNYVLKDQNRAFYPTEVGILVSDLLSQHFPQIVNYQFTAQMETDLDAIASGQLDWATALRQFYLSFKENLDKKYEEVTKEEILPTENTSEICEKCGRPMVIKFGRFGKFLACSGFPECKNTKPLNDNKIGLKCPKCQEGDIIIRRAKKSKKIFYGCSRWPDCDYISNYKPIGKYCPECGEMLQEVKNKIKCSNPNCHYEADTATSPPTDE